MNSASRLNHFIEALFSYENGAQPLQEFIVKYYGLQGNKDPLFYSRFARTLALPSEAERLVRLHPESMPAKIHLKWIAPVNNFFVEFSPAIQINQLRSKISEPTRDIIALVAHTANKTVKSPRISDADLEQIRQKIGALIEDIRAAPDLSEKAREYILSQCYRLESCLDDIAFFGDDIAGVKLQATYGAVFGSTVEAAEVLNHEVGRRFWEIAEKLSTLYALYDLTTALPWGKVVERLTSI